MLIARASQQLLHSLPRFFSVRSLQAGASATVASFQPRTHIKYNPVFASELYPQRPAAGGPSRSSSSSSSKEQQSAQTSSIDMAAPAAASTEGYDNQWGEHWKQGVSPGQVCAQ
jgi:hypothetical protein